MAARKSPSIIPVHRSLLRKSPSIIPVHRSLLRKSPSIIPVHRSLLGSSPNPKYPHPDQYHARFPSTAARAFSTGSGSGSDLEAASDESDVGTRMRRSLGIGDAEVIFHTPKTLCLPPQEGFVKIHFGACDDSDVDSDYYGYTTGCVAATARNSSGKVVGMTVGDMQYINGEDLVLGLYALKAAANLAEALNRTGVHLGPVVYETSLGMLVCCFTQRREGVLQYIFPSDEDLQQVGRSCTVYCGSSMDRLRELYPDSDFFDRLESGESPSGWR